MVVRGRLSWLYAQLQSGRATRVALISKPGRITINWTLEPFQEGVVADNSMSLLVISGLMANLEQYVSVDHGHQRSSGRTQVSISLSARQASVPPVSVVTAASSLSVQKSVKVTHAPVVPDTIEFCAVSDPPQSPRYFKPILQQGDARTASVSSQPPLLVPTKADESVSPAPSLTRACPPDPTQPDYIQRLVDRLVVEVSGTSPSQAYAALRRSRWLLHPAKRSVLTGVG